MVSGLVGQHADHRIATGDRMVGQEDQRLSGRRDLDRAADQALGGEFARNGASQRWTQ